MALFLLFGRLFVGRLCIIMLEALTELIGNLFYILLFYLVAGDVLGGVARLGVG